MKRFSSSNGFGLAGAAILLVLIALAGFGGWYMWQAQVRDQNQNVISDKEKERKDTPNILKIPELGVELDEKDGITPLYLIQDYSYNDVKYKLVQFSTQQLVAKGAAIAEKNPCRFDTDSYTGIDHSILSVAVFDSRSDLLRANNEDKNVTESSIKPENGYLIINNKIFAVPQEVQQGSGDCLEGDFESQQRISLRNSLMTLRELH